MSLRPTAGLSGTPPQIPFEASKALAAGGFAVFPCHSCVDGQCTCGNKDCHSPGKHPKTIEGLHAATADEEQLDVWCKQSPDANIAIATGETSGIVVVDIDSPKGGDNSLLEMEQSLGKLPPTVTAETGGGGLHLYFRYPRDRKITSRSAWRAGIDIKSDGGYVIAPPSRHRSGGTYRFAEGLAPGQIELAELPGPWLETLPQKTTKKIAQPQRRERNAPADDSQAELLKRARAYVAKAEPATEGSRNDSAFRLAGHVAAICGDDGFALCKENIFTLMSEWNSRCNPPLGERELRTCVASALKSGTPRPLKERFDGSEFGEPSSKRVSQSSAAPILKLSLAELCVAYPHLHPPVIDGLLREGETCNLISYSKVGKSWLAYSMLVSVISGTPWLGRFRTKQGKVLLIDNELHPATLADRLPRVADKLLPFQSENFVDNLDVIALRGNLRTLADLEETLQEFEPGTYKLIVLDAMYRFAIDGVSENDNAAMAEFYNGLDRIAARTKAAIVVVHHSAKGYQNAKRVTDVGAGAGAQSRAADTHLVIREHKQNGVFVLEAAVRSFPGVEPMALTFEYPAWIPLLDVDPTQLRTPQMEHQDQRDEEATSKITKALADGPATPRKLRDATGMGRDRIQRLLSLMEAQGHVEKIPTEVKGNPTYEYRITAEGKRDDRTAA